MPTMDKAKYLNGVSRYFLIFAVIEYQFVAVQNYMDGAFNLSQVGGVDPALEGLTKDEVYELYTSIPNERAKRLTFWNVLFVRVGAIFQSTWGFAMLWAAIALPYKNRYPFHFLYCWVAFLFMTMELSLASGVAVGADILEKYDYEAESGRYTNAGFMMFLLLVHMTLAVLSVLEKKSDSKQTDVEQVKINAYMVEESPPAGATIMTP